MKKTYLLFTYMLFCICTNGQVNLVKWTIGGFPTFNNEINFTPLGLSITSSAKPSIHFSYSNAQIESNGKYFFSNGVRIYNDDHKVMLNGDSLSPSPYSNYVMSYNMGAQWPQGSIFLPDPGDTNRLYLFHTLWDSVPMNCLNLAPTSGHIAAIQYSIIDKSLDSGRGDVIQKNSVAIADTLGGSLLAIRHANGRDWWVVARHMTQPVWLRILVTPNGILGPYRQTVGTVACSGYWNLKFSGSTNKVGGLRAFWTPNFYKYADVWDFDRCTGLFSNLTTITINRFYQPGLGLSGGCAFSPSGQYLYAGVLNALYQIDVTAPNVTASLTLVDSNPDPFVDKWFLMQLGPDGKIYTTGNGNAKMNVINYPDSGGITCNPVRGGIILPNFFSCDLPNIPLYLGPVSGSPCDTVLWTGIASHNQNNILHIYPNPASNQLTISNRQLANGKEVTVTVYDVVGKAQLQLKTTATTFDISAIAAGIYMLQVQQGDKLFYGKFVKE